MARASTSAANFGLLLVALVLMLHSVVGELAPRHVRHHLFAREDSYDECHTDLVANYKEYKTLCEDNNDPKKTCFTHWAGDLKDAKACSHKDGSVREKLMIKDDTMKDFTIDSPYEDFKIIYPHIGGVSLTYTNFNNETGCKDIGIQRGDNHVWRIWVSDEYGNDVWRTSFPDEVGNDRDIDTLNFPWYYKTFCSKWIHIHVKRDGRNWKA
ncbi:uncharacterized protein UDID_17026 [Ustilago sp. UG-2017a]|nr:uncharacterized protein UDID_17026 [Ustilago sp. UG-2017a]